MPVLNKAKVSSSSSEDNTKSDMNVFIRSLELKSRAVSKTKWIECQAFNFIAPLDALIFVSFFLFCYKDNEGKLIKDGAS